MPSISLENSYLTPPLDAHNALLKRGFVWQPCTCTDGKVWLAYAIIPCEDCWSVGGHYVKANDPQDVLRPDLQREGDSRGG